MYFSLPIEVDLGVASYVQYLHMTHGDGVNGNCTLDSNQDFSITNDYHFNIRPVVTFLAVVRLIMVCAQRTQFLNNIHEIYALITTLS